MDLLEELHKKDSLGRARVDWLLHRDAVAQALAAGYTARSIWSVLHEQGLFRASYSQFATYARSLRRRSGTEPPEQPRAPQRSEPATPRPTSPASPSERTQPAPRAAQPSFVVDPFADHLRPSAAHKRPSSP